MLFPLALGLAPRTLRQVNSRLLRTFARNFLYRGIIQGGRLYRRRRREGTFFPPAFFLSVTGRCNLDCIGCCAHKDDGSHDLAYEALDRIVGQAEARGTHLFGLVGGEPLLRKDLFDLIRAHPRSYFLLITNGTMLSETNVDALVRAGNVAVMVSLEGAEAATDERRGRHTYVRVEKALRLLKEKRLLFGVGVTVTTHNLAEVTQASFLKQLVDQGALFAWFFIYRPSGSKPGEDLMLSAVQMRELRTRLLSLRRRLPIVAIDNFWDAEPCGYCPAAAGLAYHVNARGGLETCPPLHFSLESLRDGADIYDQIVSSPFLRAFRELHHQNGGGCPLLEYPAAVAEVVKGVGAADTTGYGAAELACLAARTVKPAAGEARDGLAYSWVKRHMFV